MAKDKKNNITELKNVPEDVLYGGKIPPHSRELEMNVLGGMIIDNTLIDSVSAIIKEKHFYVNANSIVFKGILRLREKQETVDLMTLTEELKSMGELDAIGGPYYLAELSTSFSSQESIIFSARKILENWVKRDMILLTYSLNEQCYDPTIEAEKLLEKAQREIFEVSGTVIKKNYQPMADEVLKVIEYGESLSADDREILGVPSGYEDLDKLTGGFQKSELIIIAGRPGEGKSALALCCARNAAIDHGKNVGIFSIEMSNREFAMREICMEADVNIMKFKQGALEVKDFDKLKKAYGKIKAAKGQIIIDDTAPLSMFELRSKARRMVAEHNIDMIMVDYLQLMEMGADNSFGWRVDRHLEIAYITRSLKMLAKELDIPVVALSQLSRKVEDRAGKIKKPQLADLRESGAIEQDADVVIFVSRPEAYLSKDDPEYDQWKGIAIIILAKQRNGPTDDFKLGFQNSCAKFYTKELGKSADFYRNNNDDAPF